MKSKMQIVIEIFMKESLSRKEAYIVIKIKSCNHIICILILSRIHLSQSHIEIKLSKL